MIPSPCSVEDNQVAWWQVTATPASIDGSSERRAGREGVVWRLCSSVFADYVYVNLDLVGNERSEKVVFLELRDVEPIED